MEKSVSYNEICDEEYLSNYKIYETMYFNEGKIHKYITGSGLFKNDENKLVINENFIPIHEDKLRDYKIRNLQKEGKIQQPEILDDLITNCKFNLREKEQLEIREEIESEIKPKIIQNIYSQNYPKIKETLQKEAEAKIKNDIYSVEINEFQNLYKNLKEIKNKNLPKLKGEFKTSLREEMKEKYDNEVNRIEKRIKYEFVKKLQNLKTNLSNTIKNELESEKKSIVKEINDLSGRIYSQSLSSNLKQSKSAEKKPEKKLGTSHRERNTNKIQIKKVNKKRCNSTVAFEITGLKLNKTANLFDLSKEIKSACFLKKENQINEDKKKNSNSNKKENDIEKSKINKENFHNFQKPSSILNIETSSYKSADINYKINQEISKEENQSEKKFKINSLFKPTDNSNKVDQDKISQSPQKLNLTQQETKLIPFPKYECVSLKIEESTPISMKAFGKFIPNYIEREENFKLFLENNSNKLKKSILNKFSKSNKSDHCMLDLLFELWDNLDVSNQQRYKILISLENSDNIMEIYSRLDKETEILSQYYENSKDIFSLIKKRERKKSLLQAKINRSKKKYF
jgi:hypothetical protein